MHLQFKYALIIMDTYDTWQVIFVIIHTFFLKESLTIKGFLFAKDIRIIFVICHSHIIKVVI
jgi:hypothetical protein